MTDVDVRELLRRCETFRSLPDPLLDTLAGVCERVEVSDGDVLISEGSVGDSIYLLTHGALQVFVAGCRGERTLVGAVCPGETVGEMQLVVGGRRTASVIAAGEAGIYRVPIADFERLAQSYPAAFHEVCATVRRRLLRTELAKLLPDLLGSADADALAAFESRCEWVSVSQGEYVCRQGSVEQHLYLVVGGRMRVVRESGNEHLTVGELARGDVFGESALLAETPRTASVVALRDAELVRLDRAGFESLTARHPKVLRTVARSAVERSAGVVTRARRGVRFALVDTTRRRRSTRVGVDLERALARLGRVKVIDLGVDARLTPSTAAPHLLWQRFCGWLEKCEQDYDFVVLRCTPASDWIGAALGQVDQVLLIAEADAEQPGLPDELLLSTPRHLRPRQSLILEQRLHTRLPRGTRRAADDPRIDAHYHVRPGNQADFARVARTLTGQHVGVVLGGGGARGFAHIGVLQALQELDIPVDAIGGTSMGAIMAAQYALGGGIDALIEMNQQVVAMRPFQEYNLPLLSVVAGNRVRAAAEACFGDADLEDLWLPCFCVASDLAHAAEVVLRHGSIVSATCASGAIPGVLAPVVDDGRVLVDGGLMNNVPVDVMRASSPGFLIAVDVSPADELSFGRADLPSNWQIFTDAFARKPERGVGSLNIASVLLRATTLESTRRARASEVLADLYLRPPVEGIGMLEFEALEQIVALGHRHALEVIGAHKSLPRIA